MRSWSSIPFRILILIGVGLLAAHIAWASYSLHRFGEAWGKGDMEVLNPHIAWGSLRQSIKREITKRSMRDMGAADSESDAVWQELGAAISERIVDTFVSPEGVSNMLNDDHQDSYQPPNVARRYLNGSLWAIKIELETGVTLGFEMSGLQWKLVSIELQESVPPLDELFQDIRKDRDPLRQLLKEEFPDADHQQKIEDETTEYIERQRDLLKNVEEDTADGKEPTVDK